MKDPGFDQEKLQSLGEYISSNPSAAETTWEAETRWVHGFRSEAHIGPHMVPMDEPVQIGGSGTAPNMVEIVLGAYGCCLTTGYVAEAAKMGIELLGVQTSVTGKLDLRPFMGLPAQESLSPGFTEIDVRVKLDAPGASRGQLDELHQAVVSRSPVGNTLRRPVQVHTNLELSPS